MLHNKLSYLQVGPIILGDKGAVTLAKHRDLLLDVFYLVLSLLQVDDLDGHHLLVPVVDALVDLAEGAFPNAFLLGKVLLWVQPGILLDRMDRTQTTINQQHIYYKRGVSFVWCGGLALCSAMNTKVLLKCNAALKYIYVTTKSAMDDVLRTH